jgi:hypothetical protein
MRTRTALALAATLGLALSGCGGEDGEGNANMRPGDNCLGCHTGGEPGRFTAAGTVFTDASSSTGDGAASVRLEDGTHTYVFDTTTSGGNFFFSGALTFPLTATVTKGAASSSHAHSAGQTGACNTCHGVGNRIHP